VGGRGGKLHPPGDAWPAPQPAITIFSAAPVRSIVSTSLRLCEMNSPLDPSLVDSFGAYVNELENGYRPV